MTLNTLAKLAGVSVATVSKAFSGSEEISADTRERIFSLAREHGCFDKYNKNKFDKKVIAVISPEMTSDYYNAFLSILNREISAQGGLMTVSVSNFDKDRSAELFSYYTSYCKADGVIILCSAEAIKNPTLMPAVVIGSYHGTEPIDVVRLCWKPAIQEVVSYLKAHGHTEIGYVGEPLTESRKEALIEVLQEHGLPVREEFFRISQKRFEDAGIEVMEQWLSEGSPLPTAIITAYDHIALGAMQVLRQHNIRIPEDISIIGSDDIPVASYLETSLSSIRTHMDEACATAVDLIMKKLKNQHYRARREILLHSEFVPRDTSADAPHLTETQG